MVYHGSIWKFLQHKYYLLATASSVAALFLFHIDKYAHFQMKWQWTLYSKKNLYSYDQFYFTLFSCFVRMFVCVQLALSSFSHCCTSNNHYWTNCRIHDKWKMQCIVCIMQTPMLREREIEKKINNKNITIISNIRVCLCECCLLQGWRKIKKKRMKPSIRNVHVYVRVCYNGSSLTEPPLKG